MDLNPGKKKEFTDDSDANQSFDKMSSLNWKEENIFCLKCDGHKDLTV